MGNELNCNPQPASTGTTHSKLLHSDNGNACISARPHVRRHLSSPEYVEKNRQEWQNGQEVQIGFDCQEMLPITSKFATKIPTTSDEAGHPTPNHNRVQAKDPPKVFVDDNDLKPPKRHAVFDDCSNSNGKVSDTKTKMPTLTAGVTQRQSPLPPSRASRIPLDFSPNALRLHQMTGKMS